LYPSVSPLGFKSLWARVRRKQGNISHQRDESLGRRGMNHRGTRKGQVGGPNQRQAGWGRRRGRIRGDIAKKIKA